MEQKIFIEQYCFTLVNKPMCGLFTLLHSGGLHITNASRKFSMNYR